MILVGEVDCEDGLQKHAKLQMINNVLVAGASIQNMQGLIIADIFISWVLITYWDIVLGS